MTLPLVNSDSDISYMILQLVNSDSDISYMTAVS
jgi:hypothetical protein